MNMMVLFIQGKHCSWSNVFPNALHLFLGDCLIDSSLLGHGRGRVAQLRELTSHTRLAPAIIKGYLLWLEKKRYDGYGYLFHRNLNEIIRSWEFGKVNFHTRQNKTKMKRNPDLDPGGILSRHFCQSSLLNKGLYSIKMSHTVVTAAFWLRARNKSNQVVRYICSPSHGLLERSSRY